jgi:hypothetical protein
MSMTHSPTITTDEEFLREAAERIRSQMVHVSRGTVGIGRDLIEVKKRVGVGKFSAWIKAEFEMSRVTAYKLIKVAETFGDCKPDLRPSVLYALIAPDTTEEVRTEIVGRAGSGEMVSVADVEALKEKTKQHAYIVEHGVAALVEAVDRGELALPDAVAFVRNKPTVQSALIAKALGSVAEAVKKANLEVKAKADRAAAKKEQQTRQLRLDQSEPACKESGDIAEHRATFDQFEIFLNVFGTLEERGDAALSG